VKHIGKQETCDLPAKPSQLFYQDIMNRENNEVKIIEFGFILALHFCYTLYFILSIIGPFLPGQ
jgi:hypothetical protein